MAEQPSFAAGKTLRKKLNESIMSLFRGKSTTIEGREENTAIKLLMESRMDVSRLQIIVFTKILHRLLEIRFEEVYSGKQRNFQACETFVKGIDEFILSSNQTVERSPSPVQGYLGPFSKSFLVTHGDQPNRATSDQNEDRDLSTLGMEAVYVTVALL